MSYTVSCGVDRFPNLSKSIVEKTVKGSILVVAYRKKFLGSRRVPVTLAFSVFLASLNFILALQIKKL